jgi:hypothetical protein
LQPLAKIDLYVTIVNRQVKAAATKAKANKKILDKPKKKSNNNKVAN